MAELARGRLRAKLPDLRLALEGRVQSHHQFLLQQILAHIDFLEQSIESGAARDRQATDPVSGSSDADPKFAVSVANRGGHRDCRDWGRHVAFSLRCSFSLMGRCLPRKLRECGQTQKWQDDRRQSLFARRALRDGLGDFSHEGQLPLGFLSSHCQTRGKKRAILAVAHKILVLFTICLKPTSPMRS